MQLSEEFRGLTPPPEFRKKVHESLSMMKLDINVVLLALLFIYRLGVKSKRLDVREGRSELLLIALIISSKGKLWTTLTS